MRPERVTLAHDLVVACEGLAPEAAWRLLHERQALPASWLDEPRRRFPSLPPLPEHERAQRLRSAPHIPMAAHPDRGDACVEVAGIAHAMERAEQHARAFIAAVAPWGTPRPDTILWAPTSASSYGAQCHDTKPGVWEPDAMVWTIFPHAAAEPRWRDISARLPPGTQALTPWALGDEEWQAAVSRDARAPSRAADRRFAELPSPFAAALGVFACGFGILPSSVDTLVLGYPTSEP